MEGAPVAPSRARKRHSAAVSAADMRALLEPALDTPLNEARDETLWLPTIEGRPVGSRDALPMVADDPAPKGAKAGGFAPWIVPVLVLGPAHAAVAASRLPVRIGEPLVDADGHPRAVVGSDAHAWGAIGRWVLALVARERAVPWVSDDGAQAGWWAVLDDPADQKRIAALAATLPPSGRLSTDGRTVPPARAAVTAFARRAVDDYVGGVAHDTPSTQKIPARWPEEARAWAAALGRGETAFDGVGPRTRERFGAEIQRWIAPLLAVDDAPFRTCFRLEPPKPRARTWRVEILSQALDDPSLMKPASDEKTLADLGRAVRVFPQLSRALSAARPSAVDLKLDEAVSFLRETAFLLEDGGFGVYVPGDRLMRAPDIGVTLKVRPRCEKGSAGLGHLGLDAIVDYDWALSLGDHPITADEFRALAKNKVPLVQVRGQWVLLDAAQIDRTLAALDGSPGKMTLRDTLTFVTRNEATHPTVKFEGSLAALNEPARVAPVEVPGALRGELRPYQLRGFSWLDFLTARGLGACLADDMGLGKTIQMLALLLHRRGAGPSLLICPTSLVGNWQREATRFAPDLRVGVHHGADRRKKAAYATWAGDLDLVITTYALAARDEALLAGTEYDAVVLDEAQNVKNPDARQSKAVRGLRSRCRIALTGTPVENRLTDLWSIMDFLNPGILGSHTAFHRQFAVPIERWRDGARAATLRSTTGPFVLRRLKTDATIISDLPEKQEMKVYCPLTREQATLYQACVDDMLARIEASDGIKRRGLVLSTMLRLKQICDHPAVFLEDGSALGESRSGKLQRLVEMLDEVVVSGDRALVFTQFSTFGERLRQALTERLLVPVLFLSGDTPRKARDEMVERFQADGGPPVFLLSVKAGGVGLNLTAASHVFHYDRWWNPAVENQATDRAFRIGQRRNVQVHKFICQGTLEEAIDEMIERKMALAEQVVGSGESWLTELDTSQLRKMFTLQAGAVEDDVV
ncbi:MAG: DEAD/DEAH box helicase [Proteobacteria bacterium]|nr:DEAD/DEAH box helicase [Pseudomonadota bacterium]